MNESGAANLDFGSLDEETQQRLSEYAANHTPEPTGHRATTAFLVVINHDNSVFATPDVNFDLVLDRVASGTDIKIGVQEVLDVLKANQQAGINQQLMMATAKAMQEQATNAELMKGLKL